MNLIMDDFLFLNIYIRYINCLIIIYFLSNSAHPAIAFLESAATCRYPRLTTMDETCLTIFPQINQLQKLRIISFNLGSTHLTAIKEKIIIKEGGTCLVLTLKRNRIGNFNLENDIIMINNISIGNHILHVCISFNTEINF